jgi:hypothetical protein
MTDLFTGASAPALPETPVSGGGDDMTTADIDLHFAHLMQSLSGPGKPSVTAAAALVSMFTRQGHICIDLKEFAGRADSPARAFPAPAWSSGGKTSCRLPWWARRETARP